MLDTAISNKSKPVIPGYELKQLLGKGGMGEVHLATQLSLQRNVAVKLLKQELAKDDQFVARFEKEGAALATLRHPQIVSIVDRGNATGTYYLVMQFVDGPSLREKMRDANFDTDAALITILLVARAIEYAHGRGVIHRDLKPENILFDEQAGGIPMVSDFGLAGLDESHGPLQRNLTQTHVSMGTASYMAPEQSVDAKSAGPRADIYSLGVMLYETLTGELPVGQFDPPSTKKPGLDKRLDAIVARCLRTSPDDRYPTATAFIADLARIAEPNSIFGKSKETRLQRLSRRAREFGRTLVRIAAWSVVTLAVVIIAVAYLRGTTETKRLPSGVELLTDFGAKFPLTSSGRVDQRTHEVSLGNGPDTVGLMALGRKPDVQAGVIDFGEPGSDGAGRIVVDAEVIGTGLEFSSVVDMSDATPGRLAALGKLFGLREAEVRSGLILHGANGRYVALVISGGDTEPTLEWALGPDRRGSMQAPIPVKRAGQRIAFRIDPESGDLVATAGEGRDARVLGDALSLGSGWRELLGDSPRVAVGCLEGRCVFRQLALRGLEAPRRVVPLEAPPPVEKAVEPAPIKPVAKPTPRPAPKPPPKPAPKPPPKRK